MGNMFPRGEGFFHKRGTRVPSVKTHDFGFLRNINHLLVREAMARLLHAYVCKVPKWWKWQTHVVRPLFFASSGRVTSGRV